MSTLSYGALSVEIIIGIDVLPTSTAKPVAGVTSNNALIVLFTSIMVLAGGL